MKKTGLKPVLLKFLTAAVFLLPVFTGQQAASADTVHVITLSGDTINPVTAEYIVKAVDRAEKEAAQALIIRLDTPGGLLNSTRLIVKRMLTAKVPIVVYIAPGGSHAGSAGVFITYASHIAAMAPSTNIAAAHPVKLGEGAPKTDGEGNWEELKRLIQDLRELKEKSESGKTTPVESAPAQPEQEALKPDASPMESKILQDTVAFIKAIATTRNRNVEWAIKSVVESSSITAQEALEKGVVDVLAGTIDDLLRQIDGRTVAVDGKEVVLRTASVRIIEHPMDARQKFFNVLADPNIAYIFLILGFYGLLFEVTHPGSGLPGILGAIFLILAFYSMQTLPTNYAGLALMFVGLCLFIAEVYVPGFGLFTLGGMVCLVLGSMLLFESADPVMRVSHSLIWTLALTTGGLMLFIVGILLKNRNRKTTVGQEGMIGLKGEVRVPVAKGRPGQVFVHGELWKAEAEEDLQRGDKITVESIEGLTLKIRRVTE